jgi:hypothetical protein
MSVFVAGHAEHVTGVLESLGQVFMQGHRNGESSRPAAPSASAASANGRSLA